MKRPHMSARGIYEPTEIFQHDAVSKIARECMVKLGFYLVTFFVYLYCMMYALLTKDKVAVS